MTSAFFVVTANAWMQQPHGFDLVDGQGDNARTVRARSVGVSANANREWFQAKMNTRIAAVNTPRAASGSSPFETPGRG
jgi:cytochrome bd-type quinol oxidase subunit 1